MAKRHNRLPIRPVENAETANAFLFGLIFNQHQKAERSWEAPFTLKDRLGTLNPAQIVNLTGTTLVTAVGEKPALHPFIQRMAKHLLEASVTLVDRYDGDARNVWQPPQTTSMLLKRLQEFSGIGKHKAIVGVFLLGRELGVPVLDDGTLLNIRTTCPSLYQLYGEEE